MKNVPQHCGTNTLAQPNQMGQDTAYFLGSVCDFFSQLLGSVFKGYFLCHLHLSSIQEHCREECAVEKAGSANSRCEDMAYLLSVAYCVTQSNRNLSFISHSLGYQSIQAMNPNQQGARGQIAHLTVRVIIRPSTPSGQLEKHLVTQRQGWIYVLPSTLIQRGRIRQAIIQQLILLNTEGLLVLSAVLRVAHV